MTLFIILFAVNFIRTLAIIAIIYFGFKLIRRYILPILLEEGVKKMQQKMQNQQKQQEPQRPEGEVTIEKDKSTTPPSSQNKGDFVDFEEVD